MALPIGMQAVAGVVARAEGDASWAAGRRAFLRTLIPLGLFVFLAFAPRASAAVSETIQAMSITNYTGFVIDSDAGYPDPVYDRKTILAESEVQAFNNSIFVTLGDTYALSYKLYDFFTGEPHPIFDSNGQTNGDYSYRLTNIVSVPPFGTVTVTNVASIQPALPLDPFSEYYLELRLFRGTNDLGQVTDYGPERFLQFTNTVSGDAALNVIATLDSAGYSRTFLVNTVPGKDSIAVDVGYSLYRYDDFLAFPTSDPVTVHLNYSLFDITGGTNVPLTTDSATFVETVQSHGLALIGFPIPPSSGSFARTLNLKPAPGQQLDPVNKLYRVTVSIDHVDDVSLPPVPGNSLTLADQQFLHFNGRLLFGPTVAGFTSIANVPSVLSTPPGAIGTSLAVDANSGYVLGASPTVHNFGSGVPLSVNLLPNGDAVYTDATPVIMNGPTPDQETRAGIRFQRGPISLGTSGAQAGLAVFLPTGLGYCAGTTSRVLRGQLDFGVIPLAQDLGPVSDLNFSTAVPPLYVCEETKAFWFEASSILWHVTGGTFTIAPTGNLVYVRGQELVNLEAVAPLLVDPAMAVKPSNEQYGRFVATVTSPSIEVHSDTAGNALLSADVQVQSTAGTPQNGFTTHFPYGVQLGWSGGSLHIVDDQVDASSSLGGVGTLKVSYARDCVDASSCAGAVGPATLPFDPSGGVLEFTPDGGLIAPGTLTSAQALTWGHMALPSDNYAQKTKPFSAATFHMPGVFLRGDQTPVPMEDRPATVLLTGVNGTNVTALERPETPEYLNGLTDYAGLNFRVGLDSALEAECVMAGVPSGFWPLTGRSKYYARASGISGIHEAVFGLFPSTATLYGYAANFSNYGLSYLDSEVHDSRTEGYVTIPYPSKFQQDFAELKFTCLGALTSAKVPATSTNKVLVYWQADFLPLAIQFQAPVTAGCDPSQGFLTLGVKAWASHVDQPLYGRLGFQTNGNLISLAFAQAHSLSNLDSRLDVPNNFKLKGPADEFYSFSCVTKAYYNDWGNLPTPEGANPPGFINVAGRLDVPFFEDLRVHLQTSAQQSNTIAPIYLMGGWAKTGPSPQGWEESPGQNYFTLTTFDAAQNGFPGSDATSLTKYHDNSAEQYHVRAQQNWLGVVNFDYPLTWSSSTRSFKSWHAITNDLLVLTVTHQVNYLSAQHAELSFGAQYDGLPQVNLANLAFNAVDQATGVAHAFVNAGLDTLRAPIDDGLNRLNRMLDAQMRDFFEKSFQQLIDPVVDNLYNELPLSVTVPVPPTWSSDLHTLVHKYVVSGAVQTVQGQMQQIAGSVAGGVGVINEARDDLAKVQDALDSVDQLLAADSSSGAREPLRKLTRSLVGDFAAQYISLATDGAIDDLLKQVAPQLNGVTNSLADLRSVVADLKAKLDAGGDFAQEIQDQIGSLSADVNNVSLQAETDINTFLDGLDVTVTNPLQEYTPEQLKALIRQRIMDQFLGSPVAGSVQLIVKQRVYDVDASIRESIDSAFQQLNDVIRGLIGQSLAQLDKTINGALGDLSDVIGAGQLKGYAHIDGDSLKLLRIDGHFQWKVPANMEFNAYLQIKELDSDGPAGCGPPGEKVTEVTVGATDVDVSWISPDLRADIGGKFSFATSPSFKPVGMGGSFELVGAVKFATFEIDELGAGLGFGLYENYLACKARVKFNKYEFFGGLFFGRTCSIEPLKLVDPDVASVLGPPPFTGAYVYAEGWIPLNEAIGIPSSCLFNIRAGVGAGAFYFAEGPTFGGKALLGVSGELLCIVSVEGEVKMIGLKQGDDFTLKGIGTVSGEIGFCPFCIDFSKSIGLQYKNGSFDVDF